MKVKVLNYESKEDLIEIEVRSNLKQSTITDKTIKALEEKFNIKVTNRMVFGKLDYATNIFDGGYILFGNDLPFRKIEIITE